MPHVLNPDTDYIVSANAKIIDYNDYQYYLGNIYRLGYRAQAIEEALNQGIKTNTKWDIANTKVLQSNININTYTNTYANNTNTNTNLKFRFSS